MVEKKIVLLHYGKVFLRLRIDKSVVGTIVSY